MILIGVCLLCAPALVSAQEKKPKKEVQLSTPFVPTPMSCVDEMLKLAEVTEKDVVFDLGSGDGRIIIAAVKKFKAKKGIGIELFPPRVEISRENAKKEGVADKVEIREGNFMELKDVSEASVITLSLLDDLNEKLMPMLKKTLKPGSRIVSYDFLMGDWKPDRVIELKNDGLNKESEIYLWKIPEVKKDGQMKVPGGLRQW